MGLSYHHTVDSPSTFGQDAHDVVPDKLNDNFDLCEANDQDLEDTFEDTWYGAFGSGILSGMEPSLPVYAGFTIDVAVGVALIGRAFNVIAQSVAVDASADPGYLFLCQDGTWHKDTDNTPPAGKSSFLYATYTSDGYETLTVSLATRGLQYKDFEGGVNGTVGLGVIATRRVPRDFWIEDVQTVLGDTGLYTNTTIDVHAGAAGSVPASIFTDQDLRPVIAGGDPAYTGATSGAPDTSRTVLAGWVLTVEVDGVATNAADLGWVIRGRYCDIVA